jgi:lipopolysaccharide exporter
VIKVLKIVTLKIGLIKSNAFIKNAATLTIGTILAQSISLIITPILSRIYSPNDYGLVTIFGAVSAISATIVSLSYPIRIVLPKSNNEARRLTFIAIAIPILLGLFLIILSLILPNSYLKISKLNGIGLWLQGSIFIGVITAIMTALTYWMNRNLQYFNISKLKVIQAALISSFGLGMGFFQISDGLVFAQFFGLILTFVACVYMSTIKFTKADTIGLISLAKKHSVAPKFLFPTAILDVFTSQLPFFLLALWFSNELVGHYRMSFALLSIPASLIGASISQVFYQRFGEVLPNYLGAKKLLVETWVVLAVVGFVPFLFVMLYGESFFAIVLGNSWALSGKIASIIAIMSFFSLLHSPTSTTLISIGDEKLMPLFGIAALVHRPLAIYLGHTYDDFYLGLKIYVLFEVVHMLLFQVIVITKLNKLNKLSIL